MCPGIISWIKAVWNIRKTDRGRSNPKGSMYMVVAQPSCSILESQVTFMLVVVTQLSSQHLFAVKAVAFVPGPFWAPCRMRLATSSVNIRKPKMQELCFAAILRVFTESWREKSQQILDSSIYDLAWSKGGWVSMNPIALDQKFLTWWFGATKDMLAFASNIRNSAPLKN